LEDFDFDSYQYHSSLSLPGQFNWKGAVDGFQECYHCNIAHPGLSKTFNIQTYNVTPRCNYCRHMARRPGTSGLTDCDGLWTYIFPNQGISCYPPTAWLTLRFNPIAVNQTLFEIDVYAHKSKSAIEMEEFVKFLKQVQLEDMELSTGSQRNLRAGIYSRGILHPEKENGVIYYQSLVERFVLDEAAVEALQRPQVDTDDSVIVTDVAENAMQVAEIQASIVHV